MAAGEAALAGQELGSRALSAVVPSEELHPQPPAWAEAMEASSGDPMLRQFLEGPRLLS